MITRGPGPYTVQKVMETSGGKHQCSWPIGVSYLGTCGLCFQYCFLTCPFRADPSVPEGVSNSQSLMLVCVSPELRPMSDSLYSCESWYPREAEMIQTGLRGALGMPWMLLGIKENRQVWTSSFSPDLAKIVCFLKIYFMCLVSEQGII